MPLSSRIKRATRFPSCSAATGFAVSVYHWGTGISLISLPIDAQGSNKRIRTLAEVVSERHVDITGVHDSILLVRVHLHANLRRICARIIKRALVYTGNRIKG